MHLNFNITGDTMLKNTLTVLSILFVLSLQTGCATLTSSEMQTVSLSTKTSTGQAVEKATCSLKNDKGVWQAESPGTVSIHRSADDLIVECKKEGLSDGLLRAVSRAAGGMFGNIIFGGGIGALIDHSKGTGYNYPNDLPVKMGESTTVDRKDEAMKQEAQTNTSPAQVPPTAKN